MFENIRRFFLFSCLFFNYINFILNVKKKKKKYEIKFANLCNRPSSILIKKKEIFHRQKLFVKDVIRCYLFFSFIIFFLFCYFSFTIRMLISRCKIANSRSAISRWIVLVCMCVNRFINVTESVRFNGNYDAKVTIF